jgi:hypothetical protein
MAKKTAKKPAGKRAAAAKTAKKKTAKRPPAKKQTETLEIKLDATEEKAFELAHRSGKVCDQLESAATLAITQAVQKVFKQHGITLTPAQGEKVALVLFGD